MPNLFLQYAFQEETLFYYLAVVLIVTFSIVLHELAHGWMAIRLGDDTPIIHERMTGNPLVHMGGWSLAVLLIFGIAWGQMPIDSSRLRGRWAEAKVAAAGPAMNLLLAIVALTALGLWWRFGAFGGTQIERNGLQMLWWCGLTNLLLCIFNLMPVPPLDGSHVLANFSRGYANLLADPSKQGMWMLAFIFTFAMARAILQPVAGWAVTYTSWVAGGPGFLMYT